MLQDLLIPEELLQLDKLESSIELCEDTSFLALLGADTKELSTELESNIKTQFDFIKEFIPQDEQILKPLSESEQSENFVIVNLFEKDSREYIKNLLFFRDYISDNTLKIVLIFNKGDYQSILKEAIDLYNISTFSYCFSTYKIESIRKFDSSDIENLLFEYKKRKKDLSKNQKISYLMQIGLKYSDCENIDLSLKYFNEALILSNKLKENLFVFSIKAELGKLYRYKKKYNVSEKYLFESLEFYGNKNLEQRKYLLEQISLLYYDKREFEKAISYCIKLEKLCMDTKDNEYLVYVYNIYISIYSFYKDYEKINKYFELAFNLAEKNKDDLVLADLLQNRGLNLIKLDRDKDSLIYLNKALTLYQKSNKPYMVFLIYKILATVFFNLEDKKKALVYAKYCYPFFKENNFLNDLVSIIKIINECEINPKFNKYEMLLESIKISKQIKDFDLQLSCILDLSSYLREINGHNNYEKFILEIKGFFPKIKDQSNLYSAYIEIINLYLSDNNLNKCYDYYDKLKNLNLKLAESELIYMNELYGEILVKDNKPDEAEEFFKKAYKKAVEKNDLKRLISLEKNLGYLYKKKDQKNLAKKYFMEALLKIETINKNSKDIKLIKDEIESL